MATPNDRLVEGAEVKSVDLVRAALAEGADPNARKQLTLSVDVPGQGRKTETVERESVLALACWRGAVDVVGELLSAGADPNAQVEWPINTYHNNWNAEKWMKRWICTYTFDNVLLAAIGRGGKVTNWDGSVDTSRQSLLEENDRLLVSKSGGHVHLTNPSGVDIVRDLFTLTRSVAAIRLLVQYGARVDAPAIAAADRLQDKSVVQLLRAHLSSPLPQLRPARSRAQSATASATAPAAERSESAWSALVSEQRRAAAAEVRAAAADARAAGLQTQLDAANARVQEAQAQLASSQARYEAQIARLTQQATALDRENAILRDRLANHAGCPALEPAPPEEVNEMMFVQFDYDARDEDEVELRMGQRVFVELKMPDAWCTGINLSTRATGFFPFAVLTPTPPGTAPGEPPVPPSLTRRTASHAASRAAAGMRAGPWHTGSRAGEGGTPSMYGAVSRVVGRSGGLGTPSMYEMPGRDVRGPGA